MMTAIKKPTTFKDQVTILEAKNVIVKNKRACERFFSQNNYYRFSAYLLPFKDKTTGICETPIAFESIVAIYNFDKELRHIISRLIESIEIDLRTKISYFHSHKYGPLGYNQASIFNKGHNHKKFKNNCKQCILENVNSPVVIHHQQKYDGKFPLWVIIEYFHLGMLSHFYTDLPVSDQKAIAKEYNTSYLNMLSWFKCVQGKIEMQEKGN